ncbi:MAG: HAMP domain-containing histidine kinase [Clostridiaceae bacterium]|nr:HAMP domain-containing histidine kinase [Clostridiaceae bacterium]
MQSIKKRLFGSHFIAIFLTVVVLEIISFVTIKNYYYRTIEENLRKQAKMSIVFYNRYLLRDDPKKSSEDLIENLSSSTNAQVQIISAEEKIIADSLGIREGEKMESEDVKKALKGTPSVWIGIPNYTNEKSLCVSYLLTEPGENARVIRLVSSLAEVDKLLNKIFGIFNLIGFFVILIISTVSLAISNSIIKPLNKVTEAAKDMALGKFSTRAEKKYNDEVGSLADTLNFMAEEITKNERLKNDFISSISHEIRTPLTSIKGWALTLKRKELTDVIRREEGLNIIIEESERLSAMVEELLDFSKFESNRIVLNIDDVDIKELLFSILSQLEPRASRNNIDLEAHIEDMPTIKADRNRLKQVFINIIDNALKFTPEGGCIKVSACMTDDKIRVSIEDNGCGIEKEHLPHILKKFYKADVKKPGSGIGLAICDEIVRLHGGTLSIDSTEKEGTKVQIEFVKK